MNTPLYLQDEAFCAFPVNFTANLTVGGETVELYDTSSNLENYTEMAFAVPNELKEKDVLIIVIMTNCMGSNYSDPIEIG